MSKVLSIQELIAQKEKIKQNKAKVATLYVKSLESNIVVRSPGTAEMLESQSAGESDPTRADSYLLLQCVKEPNLKSDELQKAYGCVEPLDIVPALFLPGEVSAIAIEIMKLAGYGSSVNKVGNDIKNS